MTKSNTLVDTRRQLEHSRREERYDQRHSSKTCFLDTQEYSVQECAYREGAIKQKSRRPQWEIKVLNVERRIKGPELHARGQESFCVRTSSLYGRSDLTSSTACRGKRLGAHRPTAQPGRKGEIAR